MNKPKIDRKRALTWRILATLTLLAVAIYILTTHWHTVSSSLAVVQHAERFWLCIAVALMALTLCIASAMYGVLALHRLRLRETLLIQLASSFVGRLLPAGLGGLGLNGLYLYRRKHSPAEATAIVSVNNLVGMLAHLLLLATVIVFRPEEVSDFTHRPNASISDLVIVVGLILVAVCFLISPVRRQLVRFVVNLSVSVKKEKPRKLLAALLLACLMTLTYTAMLSVSARAVGASLGVVQVFVVFSFGMLAGTATPTPGGLVGTEAGLFAGFTAYGVRSDQAGAAVLAFRLVSYWVPLLPGVWALWVARNRHLI